jgi:hypothetical protein
MSLVKSTTPQPKTVSEFRMPSQETFKNLFKKAITDDKPVLFDYWAGSLEKTVSICVRELPDGTKEKHLVRNEQEYTSPISNIFKSGTDFIVLTENSIYVVDSEIPARRFGTPV